jgi:hypothetical protein
MGAPKCRGPLVFELTLTNKRYAAGFGLIEMQLHEKYKENFDFSRECFLSPTLFSN